MLPASVAASVDVGSIAGYVVDAKTGKPFTDVSVSVLLPSPDRREIRVGKDGFFTALGIQPGCFYWVPILIDGVYESAQGWRDVCVFAGESTKLPKRSYRRGLMIDIGLVSPFSAPRFNSTETDDSYSIPVSNHTIR